MVWAATRRPHNGGSPSTMTSSRSAPPATRQRHSGWTPLRIATGVERTANFRTSPATAAAIREIMEAAGVSTALEAESAAGR
jgi:hypothetical protein